MADQHKVKSLEKQIKRLQVDKIELIRSTSTEIERLRRIIRTLTNRSNPNSNINLNLDKLEYIPLTKQEKDKLSSSSSIYNTRAISQQQSFSAQEATPNGSYNMNDFEEYKPENNNNADIIAVDATLDKNDPIEIEEWPKRGLGSLREEKSYEYPNHIDNAQYMKPHRPNTNKMNNNNTTNNDDSSDDDFLSEQEEKTHEKKDTMFRLNTKRMSYKGFEFGDFGFMTTDFDQLSRGHTQWVNQVMHHPVQNGIVITASDDWCVMFWRFKKAVGNDELKQEKINAMLNRQKLKNKVTPNASNNYYIDPKLQHIVGEIDLLPVLKINTGLEVKGIGMSSDGSILACTCYDEEEDEGNPELQLYSDKQQNWTFKHHQFHPYYGNVGNRNKERDNSQIHSTTMQQTQSVDNINQLKEKENSSERLISRRIISLPFEPIPHCLCFTRDNKYVFVAMYSSETILKELNDELEEEYGGKDNMDHEALSKWPDHPVSLCCINVYTQRVRECEKIWKYLAADEHVSCMAISPNGARIAIGTSLGQLIVTGVLNLTGDFEDEEDFNPLLQKIWSSQQNNNMNGMNGMNQDDNEDNDGSVTAIDWSPDSDWIICGHASGVIKFWKKGEEKRLSVSLNKTINQWMGAAKVDRKYKMFECKWYLEGLHIEAINSLSIRGSLMVSGADDGNVVIHDLLETFIDSPENGDNSPITIGKVDKIHGGRMVNSVCLTKNYSEENLLVPSTGFFMVTSGADNIVHCVSLLDVCRDSIRTNHLNQRKKQKKIIPT